MAVEKSNYARNPKPRPISVPKLHHATFMTLDVDAMVRWYELVCGLQPVYYAEHAAWLTNDEANHRIALLRLPGTKPPVDKPHTAGLHHTAFEYESFDQWLDNYARLRDQGILPAVNLHHGMTMSMYYIDPDGNGVEIQVDAWHDWAVSNTIQKKAYAGEYTPVDANPDVSFPDVWPARLAAQPELADGVPVGEGALPIGID
jgi:catechol 2,3-dioxygenase